MVYRGKWIFGWNGSMMKSILNVTVPNGIENRLGTEYQTVFNSQRLFKAHIFAYAAEAAGSSIGLRLTIIKENHMLCASAFAVVQCSCQQGPINIPVIDTVRKVNAKDFRHKRIIHIINCACCFSVPETHIYPPPVNVIEDSC